MAWNLDAGEEIGGIRMEIRVGMVALV